jgi:hypothetical protein
MPYDDAALARTLESLRAPFVSLLARTIEQARGVLAAQQAAGEEESAELGAFAAGRIDVGRFATLLRRERTLERAAVERMEAALAVLREVAGRGDALFEGQVEPGTGLRDAAAAVLAGVGRAFAAARLFELARTGRFREPEHEGLFRPFPFAQWNRTERAAAPALLLHVNGRDLHAEGLAEFLDGALKVVLVVRGDAPFAPLARLLTPGVFVAQSEDGQEIGRLAAHPGPGVLALVPESAARFVHDPAAGPAWWDRLAISRLPDAAPPPRLGGRSAAQQKEELAHLAALARRPAPVAAPAEAAPAADPAAQLAQWLLAQAPVEGR